MSQLLSKKYPDAYEEFFTSPLLVCPVEVFLEFFDMETILKVSSQKHPARERKHGGQEAILITCWNNL